MFRRLLIFFFALNLLILSLSVTQAQAPIELVIFRDENSLALYVASGQSADLSDLVLNATTVSGQTKRAVVAEYPAYRGLPWDNLSGPICLRIQRDAEAGPPPLDCVRSGSFLQLVSNADVFWYDQNLSQGYALLIYSGDDFQGLCPAEQDECRIAFTPQASEIATAVSATATPVSPAVSGVEIGVVPFLNAEQCNNLTAAALVSQINLQPTDPPTAEIAEISDQQPAAIRKAAANRGNKAVIWASCNPGGQVDLHIELLSAPVLYQIVEPTSISFTTPDVNRVVNFVVAVRYYLGREYRNTIRELQTLLPGQRAVLGVSELLLLEGNTRLFLGCYEDAIDTYNKIPADDLLAFAAVNNGYVAQVNLTQFLNIFGEQPPEIRHIISRSLYGSSTLGVHPECSDGIWDSRIAIVDADEIPNGLASMEPGYRAWAETDTLSPDQKALIYLNLGMAGYLVKDIVNESEPVAEDCMQAQQQYDVTPNLGGLCLAMIPIEIYYRQTLDQTAYTSDVICETLLPDLSRHVDQLPPLASAELTDMNSEQAENVYWRGYVAAQWVIHDCDLNAARMTAYQDEADTYLSAFIDWWEQRALDDLIFMSTRHVVANRRRDLVRQKR